MRFLLLLLGLLLAPSVANAQAAMTLWCASSGTFLNSVQPCPGNATTTNAAATIGTGNTFQTLLAASTNRRSLTIQNNNTNGDNCWVYIGASGQAEGKAILLTTGQAYTRYFPFVPSDAIQGTCANTSDTMYVDTQ